MLASARVNLATARSYSSGNDVQLLGDTVVNLAIAQIQKGTSDPNLAWISQPGLIRTFSPDGQVGAYKLYSSYSMEEDGTYDPGAASVLDQEVPTDWFTRPEEFVDLNRPVDLDGERVYPIVDPSQEGLVEGFSFDATGRVAPAATLGENPMPMPVRWIYLGKDGEFMTASDPNRYKAVARLAFWTDDDSSKININTAAGGIYFDTPAVNTVEDHLFGRTQPIAQEYQRWPGHPSTTSLSPVLKSLRDFPDPLARSEEAANLTPRIGWGGSEGGSEPAWLTRNLGRTDMDRLFASLDEFYYGLSIDGAGVREPFALNTSQTLEAPDQKIPQLGFFLTAHSRSPELNLFNRPRVSLWPFNRELVTGSDGSLITPEDRLIRLATEFGGTTGDGSLDYTKRKRFYFQREDAWDPAIDYTNIPENQALIAYLQAMTSKPIPSASPARGGGSGGSFKTKFTKANIDQLLVSMWDYIRSQINTVNQSYEPVNLATYSFPQGHNTEQTGYNDVVPLVIKNANLEGKGLGRTAVPVEAILQFYDAGEELESDDLRNNETYAAGPDGTPDYLVRKVRLVLLLSFHMPVNNLYNSGARLQVEISGTPFGMETLDSAGNPLNPNSPIVLRDAVTGAGVWGTSVTGGIGFPSQRTDSSFRKLCYLSGFGSSSEPSRGGPLSIAYPMFAPLSDKAKVGNTAAGPKTSALKVLSNRFGGAMSPEDIAQLARFTNGSSREDVYYPFVSDIIEVRLPQEPGNDETPVAWNRTDATGKVGYDNFLVGLSGSNLSLNIFPGLKKNSTGLIASEWHDTDPSDRILSTTIPFPSATIPLPRLGPDVPAMKTSRWQGSGNSGSAPNVSELSNYYLRGPTPFQDFVMSVPYKAEGDGSAVPVTTPTDVFRSVALKGDSQTRGDVRLLAIATDPPAAWWAPNPRYQNPDSFIATGYLPGHIGTVGTLDPNEDPSISGPGASNQTAGYLAAATLGRLNAKTKKYSSFTRRTASPLTTATSRFGSTEVGDFSTGYGSTPPGALVVGPDMGGVDLSKDAATNNPNAEGPYYVASVSRSGTQDNVTTTDHNFFKNITGLLFSPFRQAPSPVIFGNLPARKDDPWETPLFNPNPAGGRDSHRGWSVGPRDHYLLDLFWMPVVEPYAISENFATAGKVNLNYQIAPFTYVNRKTGLHAVLDTFTENAKASFAKGAILAMPESLASVPDYKSGGYAKVRDASTEEPRFFVDTAETIKGFDERFAANDPFVSASEICEMFLVPEGESLATVESFWSDKTLTGDDKLESPYNALYPRVTTQSNTFTVHYWVERLAPSTEPSAEPVVLGRYRGSAVVERYIDQNVEEYGQPVSGSSAAEDVFPAMLDLYKFRKVEQKQFAL